MLGTGGLSKVYANGPSKTVNNKNGFGNVYEPPIKWSIDNAINPIEAYKISRITERFIFKCIDKPFLYMLSVLTNHFDKPNDIIVKLL